VKENGENSPSCAQLLATIIEYQFAIQIFGNNPDPFSSFPGSDVGTTVRICPDNYQVFDTALESIVADK
jgi:hypothetical protein